MTKEEIEKRIEFLKERYDYYYWNEKHNECWKIELELDELELKLKDY